MYVSGFVCVIVFVCLWVIVVVCGVSVGVCDSVCVPMGGCVFLCVVMCVCLCVVVCVWVAVCMHDCVCVPVCGCVCGVFECGCMCGVSLWCVSVWLCVCLLVAVCVSVRLYGMCVVWVPGAAGAQPLLAGRVAECVAVWRGGGGSGPELLAGACGSPKALICLPRQPPLCSRAPDSQATTNTSSDAPVAQPRDRRVITAAAPDAGAPRGEGIVVSAAGQPLSGQAAGPAHFTPPAGASPMCSLGTSPHSEGPVAQVVWSLPGPLCPLILGWPLPGAAGGWLSPHPGNGLTPPPPS